MSPRTEGGRGSALRDRESPQPGPGRISPGTSSRMFREEHLCQVCQPGAAGAYFCHHTQRAWLTKRDKFLTVSLEYLDPAVLEPHQTVKEGSQNNLL